MISQQKLLQKLLTCAGFFKNHHHALCHVPDSDVNFVRCFGASYGFYAGNHTHRLHTNTEILSYYLYSQYVYQLTSFYHNKVLHSAMLPWARSFAPATGDTLSAHFTVPLGITEHNSGCLLIRLLYIVTQIMQRCSEK